MMINVPGPTIVYEDEAKAKAAVDKMNAEEDAGFSYAVKSRVTGRFIIEVVDDQGDFVCYF